MQYMLLIYDDEKKWAAIPEEERNASYPQWMAFTKGIVDSGHFRAGDALEPTSTATTVRMGKDKPVATDGPFAETKEQLGGYYLIEADNLDDAVAIAGRIPSVRMGGSVEVRPVMPTPKVE
jgi:hypothetical protein